MAAASPAKPDLIDETDWSCDGGWCKRSWTSNSTPLWLLVLLCSWGTLLGSIQTSSLLLALPAIITDLNASLFAVMWLILAYMLTTTALVPLFGRLGDAIGRARLLTTGLFVFSLGSLLCGAATRPGNNAWDMVIYRVVQGVGAALIFANTNAMVADAFPPAKLGLPLGITSFAAAFGITVGPLIGGALTLVEWQWVYYVNVPLGLVPAFWAVWMLRDSFKVRSTLPPTTMQRLSKMNNFDWGGYILFCLFIITFLLALTELVFPSISEQAIITLFVIAGLSIIGFLVVELKISTAPTIDPRLFTSNRVFLVAQIANAFSAFGNAAVLFSLIFYFQGPFGQDPFHAGVLMIPYGAALAIIGFFAGFLADRFGVKFLQVSGLCVMAGGVIGLMNCDETTPYGNVAAFQIITGLGGGLFNSPNSRTIMMSIKPEQRGTASATTVLLAGFARLIGVVVLFTLEFGQLPISAVLAIFLYGATGGIDQATLTVFLKGYVNTLWIAVALFGASAFLLLFVLPWDFWPTWERFKTMRKVAAAVPAPKSADRLKSGGAVEADGRQSPNSSSSTVTTPKEEETKAPANVQKSKIEVDVEKGVSPAADSEEDGGVERDDKSEEESALEQSDAAEIYQIRNV